MDKPRHSLEAVLEAVEKGQTVSGAARRLGIHRETMRRYAHHWKQVRDALDSQRDELLDIAEMGLRKRLIDAEPWAVTFALRTLGRSRGYAERVEHTGPDGNEIVFRVVRERIPDPPPDRAPEAG